MFRCICQRGYKPDICLDVSAKEDINLTLQELNVMTLMSAQG